MPTLSLAENINRHRPRVNRLMADTWLEDRQLKITWDPGLLGNENQTVAVELARFSMKNSQVGFDSMFTLMEEQANTGECLFVVPKGEGQG